MVSDKSEVKMFVQGASADGWCYQIWFYGKRQRWGFTLGVSDGQKGDDEAAHFWERGGYQSQDAARVDCLIVLAAEVGLDRMGFDFLPASIGAAVVNGSVV